MGNYQGNHRAPSAGQGRISLKAAKIGGAFNIRKRYFTTSQLTTRWGVSAPTVIRLIEEGQLKGLKIRGVYRVDKDSIEIYEKKVAF